MRVMVVAAGSRGDVQPLVALARGIAAAGHEVTVAASVDAQDLVSAWGLGFRKFDVSIAGLIQGPEASAWISDSAGRPFRELRYMRRVFAQSGPPLAQGLLTLAGSADLYLSGILTFDALAAIAANEGARHAMALLSPIHSTADGRAGITVLNPKRRWDNRQRMQTGNWLLSHTISQTGKLVRERLGLRQTGARGFRHTLNTTPAVLGVSPLLVPTPADWPKTVTVTGPWQLPDETGSSWQPPAALLDFLAAGPPPVCVGFGSLAVVQPELTRRVAVAAARAAGRRLILLGTTLDGSDGPDVFGMAQVPHSWLFPRVAAVIHHGGAGVTHAALRAGVPQMAVPHIADQPYWGRRLHEEGVGPAPLQVRHFTPERLRDRLEQFAQHPDYAIRAAALAVETRQERGVQQAVAALGLG